MDDFATLFLIKYGEPLITCDGAVALRILDKLLDEEPQYFDVHPYGDQRFFNTLCLVYASDPQKYAQLLGDPEDYKLPETRAVRCADEFQKKWKYWHEQLAAHLSGLNSPRATNPEKK